MSNSKEAQENYKKAICTDSGDDECEILHTPEQHFNKNDGSSNEYIEGLVKRLMEKIVYSEKEAYLLYCDYAHAEGFSVRKGKPYYFYGTQKIRAKTYLCSCEGEKDEKASLKGTASFNKLETRTGCKAMVWFSVDESGQWKVTKFIRDHNHELAKPYEVHLLRSARAILKAKGEALESMIKAGIYPINAFSYMSEDHGVNQNLGFTKKDCHDFANILKTKVTEVGDAQSLINLFKSKSCQDGLFYWDVQLDGEGRMANLFWRDGRSKIDYDCFGEVVSFDSTFRINRYDLICAPFIGINHHWQNVMFGCAFLSSESTESLLWLFKTFVESMGNKHPATIFTDQDQLVAGAIREVFPNTRHRLCPWHILQDASSHLGALIDNKGFHKLFHKCMVECDSEREFEETWAKMISEHNTQENTWLGKLYTLRHKWSIAFNNDIFHAGIKSMSRSESTNHVLNEIGDTCTSLANFVVAFEEIVKSWHQNERAEDFCCKQGMPQRAIKDSPMLKHAAKHYTHKIYRLFEKEYLDGIGATKAEELECGNMYKFKCTMYGRDHSNVKFVELNTENMEVKCSCMKFESMGILCSHALSALNAKDVIEIPERYLLQRWTKDVKKRLHFLEVQEFSNGDGIESEMNYSNNVMKFAYSLVMESKSDHEARCIVSKALESGAAQLHEYLDKQKSNTQSSIKSQNGSRGASNNYNNDDTSTNEEPYALDPLHAKPKGISNERYQNHWKKRNKRSNKMAIGIPRENKRKGKKVASRSSQPCTGTPTSVLTPSAPLVNLPSFSQQSSGIPSVYPSLGSANTDVYMPQMFHYTPNMHAQSTNVNGNLNLDGSKFFFSSMSQGVHGRYNERQDSSTNAWRPDLH